MKARIELFEGHCSPDLESKKTQAKNLEGDDDSGIKGRELGGDETSSS